MTYVAERRSARSTPVEGEPPKKRTRKRAPRAAAESPKLPVESGIADGASEIVKARQPPGPLLFATNQLNLVSIVGCGYLKPRAGFSKYYHDLLEAARGWIPLLYGPCDSTVVREVTLEPPSLPVALELSAKVQSSVHGPVEELSESDGPSRGLAIGVPIALSEVSALHFRTEAERDEVLARSYDGIDLSWFDVRVSPHLFSTGVPMDVLGACLARLSAPNDQVDFHIVDRLAGAIAAVLSLDGAVDVNPGDLVEMLAVSRSDVKVDALRCIRFEDASLRGNADSDAVLLSAAMRVLARTDRNERWNPPALVKAVNKEMGGAGNSALVEMLRTMWRVTHLEIEYADFSSKEGGDAANALLWILTRPEPTELLEPPKQVKVSDRSRLYAAILSGILNGFELLPSRLRAEPISRLLWKWQAERLSHPPGPLSGVAVDLEIAGSGWRLLFEGTVVAKGRHEAVAAVVVDPIEEIEAQGWHECLMYEVAAAAEQSFVSIVDGRILVRVAGPISISKRVDEARYAKRKAETRGSTLRRS